MRLITIMVCLVVCLCVSQSCTKEETSASILDSTHSDVVSKVEPFPSENFRSFDPSLYSGKLSVIWVEKIIEIDRFAYGMRPCATARSLAYINLVAYETLVVGMTEYQSNVKKLEGFEIDFNKVPKEINWRLALNAAYAEAINHFLYNLPPFPRSSVAQLEYDLMNKYAKNTEPRIVKKSIDWGKYVAKQVIAYSKTDLFAELQQDQAQPKSYEPDTGAGYWTYAYEQERALFPYWGAKETQVRTFIIAPDETTTVPPITFSTDKNSAYYKEMLEVMESNNEAKENKGENYWIAEFWSDDVTDMMMSPPVRQFSICKQLCENARMDLGEALYLNLKLGFSLNDAAVSAWKYKYDYMVMRPSNYINKYIDPSFQTNLYRLVYWPNPSFPGYPSGHSTFASAAAGVFVDFFGNNVGITDISHKGRDEFRGEPRRFYSITSMAKECAFSRVPLGVHMRQDCVEGFRLGYEISDAVNKYNLRNGYYE